MSFRQKKGKIRAVPYLDAHIMYRCQVVRPNLLSVDMHMHEF